MKRSSSVKTWCVCWGLDAGGTPTPIGISVDGEVYLLQIGNQLELIAMGHRQRMMLLVEVETDGAQGGRISDGSETDAREIVGLFREPAAGAAWGWGDATPGTAARHTNATGPSQETPPEISWGRPRWHSHPTSDWLMSNSKCCNSGRAAMPAMAFLKNSHVILRQAAQKMCVRL